MVDGNLLWDTTKARTLVVYDSSSANQEYLSRIPSGVEIEKLSSSNPALLAKLLAMKGCNKILWECGPILATEALKHDCIQETLTFISPKLLGGNSAMTPLSDFNFTEMKEVINLKHLGLNTHENDIFLRNYIA